MSLQWLDTQEIAIALAEKYSDVDPRYVNFPDLHQWVCALENFEDDPKRSNERILESIQQHWINEVN
jgi:FeS assembly protein IscX